jgi:hypothetical protein
MREIRIDICQLSPRTGLLLRTGTVRSCIIPRVGECIRHRDIDYTVRKVIYDYDEEEYHVDILVVPGI